jgi:hypothetical protein
MSGQDELERYERTEARDLVRLFEMSRPQGELRAPPDFRLKVLSKIEKNTSRRGVFSWLHVAFTTTWVPRQGHAAGWLAADRGRRTHR